MKPPILQRYGPASGNTGVEAFAILPEGLLVRFRSGEGYLYDRDQPGARHLARMTQLARQGHGLSTYISQNVQNRYRLKLTGSEFRDLLADVNASRERAASG